jgi:hypothetical protein
LRGHFAGFFRWTAQRGQGFGEFGYFHELISATDFHR